jgi:lysozyme
MDVKALIKKHEGVCLWAYTDSLGIWTVACGFNLERAGAREALLKAGANATVIYAAVDAAKKAGKKRTATEVVSMTQVDTLLDADIATSYADLRSFIPTFDKMPENARAVLVDLHFNMGGPTLRTFKTTLGCFKAGDWAGAADGLKKSKWATQVGIRAQEDIGLLLVIK